MSPLRRQIEAEVGHHIKMQRVPAKQALQVACPACDAKPGDLCILKWPKTYKPNTTSARGQMMLRRVGQPTERPHRERRTKFAIHSRKEAIEQQLEMLQEWLQRFGGIFNEP